MAVYRKQAAVSIGSENIAFTGEKIIKSEINIACAVIVEHIHVNGMDHIPLRIEQFHGIAAVLLLPDQVGRIEVVICKIVRSLGIVAFAHESGIGAVQTCDAPSGTAAQE